MAKRPKQLRIKGSFRRQLTAPHYRMIKAATAVAEYCRQTDRADLADRLWDFIWSQEDLIEQIETVIATYNRGETQLMVIQ